jgi:hypothetical protein
VTNLQLINCNSEIVQNHSRFVQKHAAAPGSDAAAFSGEISRDPADLQNSRPDQARFDLLNDIRAFFNAHPTWE